MSSNTGAKEPEELSRMLAERLNCGDAKGAADLYEETAVLAYPADQTVIGKDSIREIYQEMVDAGVQFGQEVAIPTVRFETLALTSTRSADGTGVRVQVLRQQRDGSWLRIIDRPEVPRA